jgi:hypothetical protein
MGSLKQGISSNNELIRFSNKFPKNLAVTNLGIAPHFPGTGKAVKTTGAAGGWKLSYSLRYWSAESNQA